MDTTIELTRGAGRPIALRLWSDDRLARRAAQGDAAAFAVIFERHHQALYRYCRAILRHDEDARDALQTTFARAIAALDGETREIAIRPWLYRIAHNEAISIARRRRPHTQLEEHDASAMGTSDPHEELLATEQMRALVSDLQSLPDRQRSALLMRELNELPYPEIGAALDTSEQAARQAVYEARVMLQELKQGREMSCDDVRRLISERDGRLLRPRRVRAHMRSCEGCTDFRTAIGTRRAELGALAPPLPAAAAASLLSSILGGGGGGWGGGGLIAALTSAGHGVTAGIGSKGLAAVAALTLAGGAVVVTDYELPNNHYGHKAKAAAPTHRAAATVLRQTPAAHSDPGVPSGPLGAIVGAGGPAAPDATPGAITPPAGLPAAAPVGAPVPADHQPSHPAGQPVVVEPAPVVVSVSPQPAPLPAPTETPASAAAVISSPPASSAPPARPATPAEEHANGNGNANGAGHDDEPHGNGVANSHRDDKDAGDEASVPGLTHEDKPRGRSEESNGEALGHENNGNDDVAKGSADDDGTAKSTGKSDEDHGNANRDNATGKSDEQHGSNADHDNATGKSDEQHGNADHDNATGKPDDAGGAAAESNGKSDADHGNSGQDKAAGKPDDSSADAGAKPARGGSKRS